MLKGPHHYTKDKFTVAPISSTDDLSAMHEISSIERNPTNGFGGVSVEV